MSGALTRILNNQIYSKTIIASQKIADGSITGSLFASNVTVPGDLLISGNLFVLGSSSYTTIASTNTYVNDPLVVLNNGFSGTNTYDEGLIFNRGTSTNQAIIWSEYFGEFRLISTAETGTTYGNVNSAGLVRLSVGSLNVPGTANIGTLAITNVITASSLNVSGNVLAAGGVYNALTVNGTTNSTVINVSNINVGAGGFNSNATVFAANFNTPGNVISTGAIHNSLTVNGNETISGYINAAGNISTPQLNAGQINTTGNVLATAGVFNGLTVNGNESVTGYLNVTGNVLTAQLNAGQINTTGNVLSTGLSVFGNTNLGLTGQVSGSWINVIGNITQTSSGGPVYFNTTGNVSAAVGVFGAINSTGYINTSGNISAAQLNAGQINTTGNVLATGAVVNALTVNGNETISGYINAAGNISTPQLNAGQVNTTGNVLASAGTFNALTVNGNESVTGYLNVTGNVLGAQGTFSGITSTGYINSAGNISTPQLNAGQINTTGNVLGQAATFNSSQINGNESVTGYLNVTGNILGATGTLSILGVNNNLWANAAVATTTQGTGAIVVPNGGISVAGAANIALTTTIGGATQINNTLGVGGITTITDLTNSNQSASSGALQVAGGASITKDVWIGGNLYVANIVSQNYQILTVIDPLLYLKANNSYPYNYDIGFYSHFTGPAAGIGNLYQHTGVVRDDSDGYWKIFSNAAEPAGSTVVFDVNTIYDGVKAGNLVLTNTTASTTTGTGALVVAGGAGIAGTVVAGQLNSTGNILGQAGTFNALTVNGNESVTGYLNVTGNVMAQDITGRTLSTRAPYGNIYLTQFASIYAQGNSSENQTLVQVSTTGLTDGAGLWAFTGAYSTLYSSQGISFRTGATMRDQDTPTGGVARVTVTAAGDLWANAVTTSTSTTSGALVVSGGVGIAGNLNVGSTINTTGNVVAAAGTFSSATVNGDLTATGLTTTAGINSSANILATGGTFSSLTVNGNESVTGYLNVTGNVMAAVVTASQLNTTGNVLATAGTFNALTVNGNESVTGYLNVTGNVLGAAATFSSVLSNGVINTTGNVLGQAATFNSSQINGNESVTGYLNVTGNIMATRVDATVIAATGVIWANSTTDTTSTTTGAIITAGGINAAGNAYIGKNLYVGGASAFTVNLTAPTIIAVDNGSSYAQMAQINTALTGSADFIAYPGDYPGQSSDHGWMDMGFTGTAFNDANYSITKPQDGYLFASAANTTVGGNLVLSTDHTGNFNDIVFGVGSFLSTAEVARFHGNVGSNGNLRLSYATVSTTPQTGALTVVGGVGAGGNLRVGGGAVINSAQTHDNFVVMGAVTTGLIYADVNNSAVTVGGGGFDGTGSVTTTLGASFKVDAKDSMMIPVGTTAERPGASANVAVAGMMRFNSTITNMEFYDGSTWQTAGSVFTVISDRQFSGTGPYGNVDGTNYTFTIQASSTTAATIVSINGVIQFPTLAYSVSGTTLTFTEAPAVNDVVDVRVLATTSVVSTLANGNGLNQFIAADTGSQIWTGTSGSGTIERINVDPNGTFNFLTGNDVTYDQTAVNVPSASAPVLIDTFSTSSYTTAKYIVQIKNGTTAEAAEILLTQDTTTPYLTTYGVVGSTMGTFSCNIASGNVRLYYTSTSLTNSNVKVMTTYIV